MHLPLKVQRILSEALYCILLVTFVCLALRYIIAFYISDKSDVFIFRLNHFKYNIKHCETSGSPMYTFTSNLQLQSLRVKVILDLSAEVQPRMQGCQWLPVGDVIGEH